ncbi:hypothetical protein PC121_g5264 [Phytophthora cactorum]|nr:hypothetical protein PC121_g5264 [Phytophthora cactorum]
MEEADEIKEPENKPKLPLPTPPPFHPITKAPNTWEIWAILERANHEKSNEACLVQKCDKKHHVCATWVWATTLFVDGFGKEMLRIDKWKDQYGHLTYAQVNKRFPPTYKASAHEDDEDPRDEVEIIEMCVHDTEAEICAAPDSQLLKRARIGYIKHLEVARKERAELRRRNRQNMRNAEISVEMLERYKNVEGGPNGP